MSVNFPPTHVACDAKGCRRKLRAKLWEYAGRETDGWREISGTTGAAKTLHTCPIHTLRLEELLEEPLARQGPRQHAVPGGRTRRGRR